VYHARRQTSDRGEFFRAGDGAICFHSIGDFLADSNAAITKGIVALILSAVQDKPAAEVARMDIHEALALFELRKHLSANRTQGVPNMIALVKATAERYTVRS